MKGLYFNKFNTENNSDIRLIWDSTNLLSRTAHTAIWRYLPFQQTGYYALCWHSPNTGAFDSGAYSWGCHPWPAFDNTVDANGYGLTGAGSVGVLHYHESAISGSDALRSVGESPGVLVDKRTTWFTQVRKCRLMTSGPQNGNYEETFIPDLYGNPSFKIQRYVTSITGAGSTPAFYFGGSDWQTDHPAATQNDETPAGILTGIQLYGDYLSDADHATEAANRDINAAQTSAGQTALWYINQNPTPNDVTDKKTGGTAHNPRWVNAFRPSLFQYEQKNNYAKFPLSRMRR
jgi:hypothetical protein